ncbi:hypothetical protein HPP92_018557 [Vanilla planifolia]|uniref:Pentatricopeptide repeat-containing protein n=1 Tax=Vanilla planifolia TaxID=51239 RepID=A0A835QBA0_VANPL|nr:hypothetical protein HPP92_019176 [Vanilla planifolia]KAG0469229.1 hypothetical protein HPP92_018557 [Vanilla planifolia]
MAYALVRLLVSQAIPTTFDQRMGFHVYVWLDRRVHGYPRGPRRRWGDDWAKIAEAYLPETQRSDHSAEMVRGGKRLQKYQLNRVVRELRKHKRFKHALEVCEWMRTRPDFRLLPGDYAVHLDLIAKVRGLESAEKFFEDLPERMKVESTCNSLLHVYVQRKMSAKAECLMEEMASQGLLRCCIPYNHMLALYVSTGELEKMQEVINELKKHTLPNEITYNLLLSSCTDKVDVNLAEKVMMDMEKYKLSGDWMTYSTLASIYVKAGIVSKAREALMEMEKRISRKDRTAYCSLISLYTILSDIQSTQRVWTKMKSMFKKMSDAEYKCILISLVKLGIVEEAENIYNEWELVSGTRDSRISNVLLGCYAKNDMEKAEKFHKRAMNAGIKPSYTTWEILALGYLRLNKMDKVLHFIKEAFSSVDKWEPNVGFVSEVFVGLEKAGDAEGAEQFLVMLRDAGYVTTEIYNFLLRTYVKAQKMPLIISERMRKDKVSMDEETSRLLSLTNKFSIASASNLL